MPHGSPSYELDPAALLRRREGMGWSQRDLAEACKAAGQSIHHAQISNYENGKATPRPKNLLVITQVLGCTQDDLTKAAA